MYRSSALGDQGAEAVSSGRLPAHRRIILLFVALALLQGFIYAAVIPPWQSPDEHGHFEYAWLVSRYGPTVGPEAISIEFQRRVLESMRQCNYWRLRGQSIPERMPTYFNDPVDRWLQWSRPQVGDERVLYYLLVGGLLRLVGDRDLLTDLYIGRAVSVLLFAVAVGLTALGAQSLFRRSPFMQVVPPTFVLCLPMLGEMGAAVNSDALGALTGTLIFVSLIPVFRDGLSWKRGGMVLAALTSALLSKKTTLFLIPTALLAIPIYWWTRGKRLSWRIWLALGTGVVLLILAGLILKLLPSGNAAGWRPRMDACGPTRTEESAYEGDAALLVGVCDDGRVTQGLLPEVSRGVAGHSITLSGWIRSATDTGVGVVSIRDSESYSQAEIAVGEEWQPFSLTHTVASNARWVAVWLSWGGVGGPLLFDNLVLTPDQGRNLLVNASAEQEESLLFNLVTKTLIRVGGPARLAGHLFVPQSWSLEAWREYKRAALFCFRSFWGNFGWLAIPLPQSWYRAIEFVCLLALGGNLLFVVRRPGHGWQTGYIFVLMGGLIILSLQTMLPMIGYRGTYWLPQGRYLFPGVFAIAVLMAWGFYQLLPRRWEYAGMLVVVGLTVAFDVLCLGLLIVPYFHRR